MRYSKDPLARAIFRRVVILGALIMLVWMPYHILVTDKKLAKDAASAYRMKSLAESKDALMQVVLEARKSTRIPTVLFVVTIVLLLLAAASISKPVGTLQSFLREIIHDLRGPVSSFKHNVEYALAGYKEPKTALEEMQESSETLLEMFDMQSEIIRNYNGEVREPLEDVDISDVITGLADMFESAAEAKGVKLSCDVPFETIVVRSHRQKLLRLVSNLVDRKSVRATCSNGFTEPSGLPRALATATALPMSTPSSNYTAARSAASPPWARERPLLWFCRST